MGEYTKIGMAYINWQAMHDRCYNIKNSSYADYGGRGIKVCESWHGENGFDNFIVNMGGRPAKAFSIDRIDVNGDYCPRNCRWADSFQQANNKRDNHFIIVNGEKGTISQMAIKYDIHKERIRDRLKRGWTPEEACEVTIRGKRSNDVIVDYNGVSKRLSDWSRDVNIEFSTLRYRLLNGWTPEEAFTTPTKPMYQVFGEVGSLSYFCRRFNIGKKIVSERLRSGWDLEQALTKEVQRRKKEGSP